jgi:hypothetical protein
MPCRLWFRLAYRAGEAGIGVCLVTRAPTVTDALGAGGDDELFEIHPITTAALRCLS